LENPSGRRMNGRILKGEEEREREREREREYV